LSGLSKRQQSPVTDTAWHPRNWGQCLTIALLWLLARLPWRWSLAVGRSLGRGLGPLARSRREIARRNLALCFPERSTEEREQLLEANTRGTGQAIAETALAWFGGPSVDRIPCRVDGEEHLIHARATGSGRVILLSAHFLALEMATRLMPDRIRLAAMYKPMRKRPVMDRAMRAARQRNLGLAISRDDVRGIIQATRAGYGPSFFGDQDFGRNHSVFVPFFGVPANTITALSRFCRMSQATVVPIFALREPNGGYLIQIQPALEGFPSGDDTADAARMNRIMEAMIRRYPEQYLWMHRRFKRRPDPDAPSLY